MAIVGKGLLDYAVGKLGLKDMFEWKQVEQGDSPNDMISQQTEEYFKHF
jgi:hypothetical protein